MGDHKPSFDLLTEPWIEVLQSDGTPATVSILELLSNADQYQRLAAALETINFAVLRILLAILYRSWDSKDLQNQTRAANHWSQKWESCSVYDEQVRTYLEQFNDRFDLKHPERPFLQVADLHTKGNDWRTLDILIPDAGEVGDLFTMRTDINSLEPAAAAQFLIHANAYDYSGIKSGAVDDVRVKGGRGYPIGICWAGWLGGTVLEGTNLLETLLLNYLPWRKEAGSAADVPVWELEKPLTGAARTGFESNAENSAAGPVELLTWPQRRLRLKWQENQVTGVLITNGDALGYTVQRSFETMTPWRFSDPQTTKAKDIRYMPASFQPGRAVWRSLPNLLPNKDIKKAKTKYGDGVAIALPAATVEWIGSLTALGYIDAALPIKMRTVSMLYGAKSSSYADILADALQISALFLADNGETLRSIARIAIRRTEEVDYALRQFNSNVVYAVSGDAANNTDEVQRTFYFAVDLPFRRWLSELTLSSAPDDLLADWNRQLRETALEIAETLLSQQPPSVWSGRVRDSTRITGPVAINRLRAALFSILGSANPQENQDATQREDEQ